MHRLPEHGIPKRYKLWDATTDDLQKTLAGYSDWVRAVAFSPGWKRIVSGSWDNTHQGVGCSQVSGNLKIVR